MKNLIILLIVSISFIIFSGCAGMHYGAGVGYLKQQKYPEAIDSFKTILEKNPRYPKAHTLLGIAYYKNEMYGQAVTELESAKELRRRDKRARLFLGMTYLRYGKAKEAIGEWNSYVEMFPSDNVSEILRKVIAALKSDENLSETVDLMTGSIEAIIALEDRIRNITYFYRTRFWR
jgi:tetratricopeptide (TPR) repeat protein